MIKNLKKLRLEMRMTQQQVADKISVSQQSINKYENHNIEPDIDTLIKIADLFEVSLDYLVGHTDIPHRIETVEPYDLNDDEASLVDNYRKLSVNERSSINMVIKNYNAK